MTFIYRFIILAFTLALSSFPSSADFNQYTRLGSKQISTIMPTSTRTVIDLSGAWQRVADGLVEGTMVLPASEPSRSSFTIRKSVRIEASSLQSRQWHLHFFGATEEVELRINGRFVMRYPGSMVPFMVRVPEKLLVSGSNTIELSISPASEITNLINTFAANAEKIHLGVLREIFLVGTPHVFTQDVRSKSTLSSRNSSGNVAGIVTLAGGNVERLARQSLTEDAMRQTKVDVGLEVILLKRSDGSIVSRTNMMSASIERERQQNVPFNLYVGNPQLWTPDSPNLYSLQVRVYHNGNLLDEYESNIGFRTIRVGTINEVRKIYLNDSALFLNGVEYVEDYPLLGPSMSFKHMEHDVSLMKTLGVNVVRFRHGSPHPYMLHLCNMYGLMVLAELPANSIPRGLLKEQDIVARMKNNADRLVSYVGNNPSVIGLGVSDCLEEGADDAIAFQADIVKLFRSRSIALIYKTVPATNIESTSEGGFDILLLRIPNIANRDRTNNYLADAVRVIRSAAVIPSFGSLVSPANMNGYSDPLSNEAQAVSIRDAYKASVISGMAGAIVWSFNDYELELPTMLVDHDDAYVCTSGLVDVWRQQRVSYAMLKSLINDEKEPLLQAREFSADTPLIFVATGLILALILMFLLNRSRRFREYVIRAIVRPYNFYADIRDQRILSTIQTSLLGIVVAACLGLVLASLIFSLRSNMQFEYLLHILIPSTTWYEGVRFVAWSPMFAVIAMSLGVLVAFFVLSIILRVGATFVRTRIYFRDTFTIVIWGMLPLVILMPVGVALHQVLSTDATGVWLPIFLFFVGIWCLFRVFRATSVVFDVPSIKVYGVGAAVCVTLLLVVLVFYMAQYNSLDFLQHYSTVVSL